MRVSKLFYKNDLDISTVFDFFMTNNSMIRIFLFGVYVSTFPKKSLRCTRIILSEKGIEYEAPERFSIHYMTDCYMT